MTTWIDHGDEPLPARVLAGEGEAAADADLVEQMAQAIASVIREPVDGCDHAKHVRDDFTDYCCPRCVATAVLPVVTAHIEAARKAAVEEALGKPLGYVVVESGPRDRALLCSSRLLHRDDAAAAAVKKTAYLDEIRAKGAIVSAEFGYSVCPVYGPETAR